MCCFGLPWRLGFCSAKCGSTVSSVEASILVKRGVNQENMCSFKCVNKDSWPKLGTLASSPRIVKVNSYVRRLNYAILRCQSHPVLLLRHWSFVSTGETEVLDATFICFNLVFTRELPEVLVPCSCSMKFMFLRDSRIQVACLKIGDESFEKRNASSNDAEMHHYSR